LGHDFLDIQEHVSYTFPHKKKILIKKIKKGDCNIMNEFQSVSIWHRETVLEELSAKLKKRGFNAVILNTADTIKDFISKTVPVDATVGLGGSVTLREAGIDVLLKSRGNTVFDHWDSSKSTGEILDARRKQLTSDYFLTSINAITIDGELVNIDGAGNRVAAMIFGPKHVIAIVGYNKIASSIDEAIWRTKNIASAKNCKRLGLNTPCAKTGLCMDCKLPVSICRITTIIDYKPMLTEFTIILTPLDLGY
jgi:L-lactate utilization protein LutB